MLTDCVDFTWVSPLVGLPPLVIFAAGHELYGPRG